MAVLRAPLLFLAITLTSARPQWWNVVDNIKNVAENVVDTAGDVAENTVDTVATSIKDKADNVVDSVGGIAENVVNTVGEVAENAVQGTVDTVSSIKDKTENVADTVGGVAGNVVDKAENVVNTVGEVAENVVDTAGNVIDTVGGVAENVVDTVGNVIDTTQGLAQLPFELFSALSFLSPFNILLSAPFFLMNMVSTMLEGLGLDYLTGLAAIFITTIILVLFKGIAAIALPFEIAAVLGNGLLVIISELVNVLLF